MDCRIFRREQITYRVALERASANDARFITFTFTNEALNDGREKLVYSDVQAMLKRVRNYVPSGLRFFAVGEYGSLTLRPHWHLLLFAEHPLPGRSTWEEAWKLGFVDVDKRDVTVSTCRYVAKYLCKDDRKDGVNVVNWSRRPGIGANEMFRLAADGALQGINVVPSYIMYGPKRFYLDQTMKRHYRRGIESVGVTAISASEIQCSSKMITGLTQVIRSGVERGDPFYERMVRYGAKALTEKRFRPVLGR